MPTELLGKDEHRALQPPPPSTVPTEQDELRRAARSHARRVRRVKLNVVAWVVGTVVLTTLWAIGEWQSHGAFEHFGNEGDPGEWSPTLWALGAGIWGLIVGMMALRVYFERPTFTHRRPRLIGRLRFHVAAWVLGMIVLTPLWALIEWQDNGGFERFSNDSRPGEWEPWILYIGGAWALVVAVFALRVTFDRSATDAGTGATRGPDNRGPLVPGPHDR
jgi:hypothetical protein